MKEIKNTKKQYWYAVMYRNNITEFHNRHLYAKSEVNYRNKNWEAQFNERPYSVKRFLFRFKGGIVDVYTHTYKKVEK